MSKITANQPIGIFDSGIGGLTIASSIVNQLPNEPIIYFGDTIHLPYGDKSSHAIQGYVKKIADFLLSHNVKIILIACNTASAAAYEMLKDYIGDQVILINVIDPVVEYLKNNYSNKKVGLIGTKLTVESKSYHKKIIELNNNIAFSAIATPLLVPIIEEGFFEHQLIDLALAEYLSHPTLNNIEALILGCTHYPVIKDSITSYYNNKIEIIDSAKIVSQKVKATLDAMSLNSQEKQPKHRFYVSDYTSSFAKGSKLFFGTEVAVELVNIF